MIKININIKICNYTTPKAKVPCAGILADNYVSYVKENKTSVKG